MGKMKTIKMKKLKLTGGFGLKKPFWLVRQRFSRLSAAMTLWTSNLTEAKSDRTPQYVPGMIAKLMITQVENHWHNG